MILKLKWKETEIDRLKRIPLEIWSFSLSFLSSCQHFSYNFLSNSRLILFHQAPVLIWMSLHGPPSSLFEFPLLIVSFCNLLCRKMQSPYKKISFLSFYLSRTFMFSSILLHSIRCFFGTSTYLDVVLALHSSLLRHESERNCSAPPPPTPYPLRWHEDICLNLQKHLLLDGQDFLYRNATYKNDHVS